jgi:hypothetical protein
METIWSNSIDEILKIGRPLNEIGIRNWALTKAQALLVIERLMKNKTPILGGDVFENVGSLITQNYDNWFCEQLVGETESEFLNRSIAKAKQYIESYPAIGEDIVLFTLVPKLKT